MQKDTVLVIGAGMGGLAAAIRLAAAGRDVTLLEAQGWPGGKMRTVPSPAGPVDAGPTVLTLRDVLEDLFQTAGAEMNTHLTLTALPLLARHFWADGLQLDLFPNAEANAQAIGAAFGTQARHEFTRFEAETRALYRAFEGPIMRSPRPRIGAAARAALTRPAILPWLAPGRSVSAMLDARFTEPRLRQLFGRYATYVGGNPILAPAVLGLIWQAEAAGVWAVQGGMAAVAQALARVFVALGGTLRLNTPVSRILTQGGGVGGVQLGCGTILPAAQIVFNGDPAALPFLLDNPRYAPKRHQTQPRSLSANVWTFAATVQPEGLGQQALAYHSVFFADDPAQEFGPLAKGRTPAAPTIYVCAQDRLGAQPLGPERFQFILNAPALAPGARHSKDSPCPTSPLSRLARFGLHLNPTPLPQALTRPQDFARLFPHSQGALYGLSPNGALATFQRPTARTRLEGLYLAGGGVHPGAGVPMALMSGKHAAAAALSDRISAPMFRPMATPGGISTGSAMTARAPSR
ncbi:MAG: FAD-dependent oxidoreductase [Roseinatronobacter sp.]|nr:FAD-dependent oxidoreductase [Roseinatronobacter sp.]